MGLERGRELCCFRLGTALLSKSSVNLRNCLCDVLKYDSAQFLDFLDSAQKYPFPNRKQFCAYKLMKDLMPPLFACLYLGKIVHF